MRKIFAFLLISALCFSFVGCSDDTTNQVSSVVTYYDGESETLVQMDDIVSQVQQGTMTVAYDNIDEMHRSGTVRLTMSSDEMKAALPESDLLRSEDEKYIQYTIGGADFYYTNDDNDNGLAAIVCYGTAYGFEPTVTTKQDIVAVMGGPEVEGEATEEARSRLLRQGMGFTYIDYNLGRNHISFFFYEDVLSLTVIYQDGLWIY